MKKIKELINKNMTFIKYVFFAGLSFILDISLFHGFKFILKNKILEAELLALTATYTARALSSLFNYFVNRNSVFIREDGSKADKRTIFKYYLLVIVQATISGLVVGALSKNINIDSTLIKIPVECVIFLVNFFVQRYFIFAKEPLKINIPDNVKMLLFGIFSSFTILMDLSKKKIISTTTKDTNVLSYLIVGIALMAFYKKYNNKYKSNKIFKVLSFIFSLFMVLGYSYDKVGSAYLVFGNIAFIIISIIKLLVFYKLFDIVINIVYEFLCEHKFKEITKKSKIIDLFNKHPFLFPLVVIIICYIPYMIAFYPAVMGYDPSNQIREFMGMHTRYMDSVILLDPNVTITNFNPVLHTLFLGGCFKIGHILGNDNLGLFIYSVLQVLLVASIFSYTIYYMKKKNISNKFLFVVLGIYALVPVFPFYSIGTNKDMVFCCFVLLYCLKLYDLITYEQTTKSYISLFIIMLFTTLTRNNGIYTIMLSLPFVLIWLRNKRKGILICLVSLLVCYTGYNKVLLPAFKISNTSIREMLSVPFQQTARLAKYHPEAFSEEDKKIIDKILDFDTLGERYRADLSDPVKNKYNIYTTNEDLMKYFGVWAKGLTKYPVVYIDSTVNNIYGYFYPDTSKWYLYYTYNTKLKEAGFNYHYIEPLKGMRDVLAEFGLIFPYIPIIGLFVNIAFVGWIYFFLFAALLVKKEYKYIPVTLPALSFLLVCVAGPANTYFRYALPYIMPLPMTLCLLYSVFQGKEVLKNKKTKKIDKK